MHRIPRPLATGARLLAVLALLVSGCSEHADPAHAATSGPGAGLLEDGPPSPVDPVGTGLTGQYYADQKLTAYVFSRLDPTVDFAWNYDSPDPRIPPEHFSARWNGQLLAPATGTYTFTTVADDGVRLWVDGQQVIDDWKDGVNTDAGTIALTAGQRYAFKLEYYQGAGGDGLQLFWTPPGGESAIVPAAYLFPAERACTPSCEGKSCGPDGCNGSCSECASGQTCNSLGACVDACTPSCQGKVCGSDGCSGSCGACAAGQSCDASSGRCQDAPYTFAYDPANGLDDRHPYRFFEDPRIAGSTGRTTVDLNVWAAVPGMTERAYVTDPGSWQAYVAAENPDGHVLLFTNTGQNYDEVPLSSFSTITSSFDVSLPERSTGATGWNGYDIWLNGWKNEVMISTVWINAYPCPIVATATFGGSDGVPVNSWGLCAYGERFRIWQLNGMTGPDATALTVDVKAMLQWLIDHGHIATQDSTLTAISFGFEVTDTHGVEVGPWSVNAFSVTMR